MINGGINCLSLTRNHSLPKAKCKCCHLKDILGWQGNIFTESKFYPLQTHVMNNICTCSDG